jgi:hypothetical protein
VIGRGGQFGFSVGHFDHSRPLVIDTTLSLSYSTQPLFYSTILGNSDTAFGRSIAAFTDSSGNTYAYIIGLTYATDFPTTGNAFQRKSGGHGATDAFFTKLALN